jgi:hypothetical protein
MWPFLFYGEKMKTYRHLNLLITGQAYNALKETSYNLNKPISEIVRQGIEHVLKRECKLSGDDTGGKCFGEGKCRD